MQHPPSLVRWPCVRPCVWLCSHEIARQTCESVPWSLGVVRQAPRGYCSGFSRIPHHAHASGCGRSCVARGTLDYLPPEMVHSKKYRHNVDVWGHSRRRSAQPVVLEPRPMMFGGLRFATPGFGLPCHRRAVSCSSVACAGGSWRREAAQIRSVHGQCSVGSPSTYGHLACISVGPEQATEYLREIASRSCGAALAQPPRRLSVRCLTRGGAEAAPRRRLGRFAVLGAIAPWRPSGRRRRGPRLLEDGA